MNVRETLALALQVVGIVMAAVGILQTWTTYRPLREFLAPAVAAWRWTLDKGRRLIRRPRSVTVAGAAAMQASATMRARATVTRGPLPPESDLGALRDEVGRRLASLHETVQDTQHALADEREARERADQKLRDDLTQHVATLEALARTAATGGLRLEALGLGFVALGTVLGAW
jgi:hypothetical protein